MSPVRQRLIAAARCHFFAHGFRHVTMDDLAREMAMSKKTLYAHFASKTELLQAVLNEKFNDIDADLRGISEASSAEFFAALHRLLACIQRHGAEIQPPFIRDLRRGAPELFGLVERQRRKLIQRHFATLLRAGRKEGMIRRDIAVRLIIEILLAATEAIMNPAAMAEFGLTPKTGYAAIIRVVLEGAIVEKSNRKR